MHIFNYSIHTNTLYIQASLKWDWLGQISYLVWKEIKVYVHCANMIDMWLVMLFCILYTYYILFKMDWTRINGREICCCSWPLKLPMFKLCWSRKAFMWHKSVQITQLYFLLGNYDEKGFYFFINYFWSHFTKKFILRKLFVHYRFAESEFILKLYQ